ncbi:hypothetical protein ERO13_D12G101050v2 [Gossypium hirsutum]|uniref:Uncharacterized protein isoform X1 n=2 Tax=Gossypium TaxID=3633 RepID=A0ABM3B685_GOSHI|nr:uncharacterized protein LOC107945575 isoform X1 [Gossypium hirsutum]KAG4115395.1 hypothetical protein ERO13_D12G101050v2 [Gossypium hirsutum]TYI50605.1 hypothetical protein E1A91_D12G113100v1 [Gossypium mustelinum]
MWLRGKWKPSSQKEMSNSLGLIYRIVLRRRHVKQLLSLRHQRCISASFRLSMAGFATTYYYLTFSSTRSTAAANKLEQAGFQNIAGMMKMILLPR